nr:MAG TPA: hypothetical protein [Caudoviricetes sp.]
MITDTKRSPSAFVLKPITGVTIARIMLFSMCRITCSVTVCSWLLASTA